MSDATATAATAAPEGTTSSPAAETGFWRPLKIKIVNRVLMAMTFLGLGQWAYYGIFRCPFIVPYVQCQNCPVVTCHGRLFSMFWGVWGGILVLTIMFGRAFCGWFCPGGTVSRILGAASKLRLNPKGVWEKVLPWGKYVLLAVSLYLAFAMLQPRVNVPIRVGDTFMAIDQTFQFADPIWIARTVFILAVFLLGVLLPAAWCKYACPGGGLFELAKRFSIFKVFKTAKCNDCDQCRAVCYMGTRPEETNCTNCGDCVASCPQDCIGIGRKPQS